MAECSTVEDSAIALELFGIVQRAEVARGFMKREIEFLYQSHQRNMYSEGMADHAEIDIKFYEKLKRHCEGILQGWSNDFSKWRGERYASCTFENFSTNTNDKKTVVAKLLEYADGITEKLKNGNGIILYGPRGTGKDHLAVALAKNVIANQGVSVEWFNGMDIYGMFRDSFSDKPKQSESELISKLCSPQVLYISDPLPPVGALTEFQMSAMFRVLDSRYSRCKATWITINVQDGAEMDTRLGAQNGDRLRDGALALFCNWPSHRKAQQ